MPNTEQQRQYQELESAIMRKVYPEAVYDEQHGEWAMPNGNGGFFVKKLGLEDVFCAIHERAKLLHVNSYGDVCEALNRHQWVKTGIQWIFNKPLSDQSDELHIFLFNILCSHD